MKKLLLSICLFCITSQCYCWGFFGHRKINYYAVFLLPPQMMVLYKPNIEFITEHAIDPDKRRYAVASEGPRHYIDIDYYGKYPYSELPHNWNDALAKYGEDTLAANGIVPWHVQVMLGRLTKSFKEKNFSLIMKNSAEIGHYIADAHVPLHASSNHNGQLTNQKGIHGFWESRIPELLADKQFDFFVGKAEYIQNPGKFIWDRVLESGNAADSVLTFEKELSSQFPGDKKYAFEKRNNIIIRQYSSEYTIAFNNKLDGMVERRMRQAIFAVASFWYTAWMNAGQPDLSSLASQSFSENDLKEFELLNEEWQAGKIKGREHDEGL
ncbi:MAG: zinc dependent phospholipase C family protein [Ginsengibacter sp.]